MGDFANPSVFLTRSLNDQIFKKIKTASEMAFLAGFAVVAAHDFDPTAIEGLAILICKPNSFHVVDDETVDNIKRRSGFKSHDMARHSLPRVRDRYRMAETQGSVTPA